MTLPAYHVSQTDSDERLDACLFDFSQAFEKISRAKLVPYAYINSTKHKAKYSLSLNTNQYRLQ